MSHDESVQHQIPVQAQESSAPNVPLLVQYKMQLDNYNKQKQAAEINLRQLEGAIFACNLMIQQYEDNAKKTAMDYIKSKNLGENNDGKDNIEGKKKTSKK